MKKIAWIPGAELFLNPLQHNNQEAEGTKTLTLSLKT